MHKTPEMVAVDFYNRHKAEFNKGLGVINRYDSLISFALSAVLSFEFGLLAILILKLCRIGE